MTLNEEKMLNLLLVTGFPNIDPRHCKRFLLGGLYCTALAEPPPFDPSTFSKQRGRDPQTTPIHVRVDQRCMARVLILVNTCTTLCGISATCRASSTT